MPYNDIKKIFEVDKYFANRLLSTNKCRLLDTFKSLHFVTENAHETRMMYSIGQSEYEECEKCKQGNDNGKYSKFGNLESGSQSNEDEGLCNFYSMIYNIENDNISCVCLKCGYSKDINF